MFTALLAGRCAPDVGPDLMADSTEGYRCGWVRALLRGHTRVRCRAAHSALLRLQALEDGSEGKADAGGVGLLVYNSDPSNACFRARARPLGPALLLLAQRVRTSCLPGFSA